ncbi:hypothetical protein [Flavobacterium sp. YO12]|uniref:hypothetical protein n=1 Tax=Flavobacterium sp. YO12 TaxID=1920029 RepID=UPI00100A3EEE|nr:hypothetical protein [Flavobacterium sp. YO12]RXM47524.1 hypothetical protein BOW55_10555 [Flavobacterium sp. YO12]
MTKFYKETFWFLGTTIVILVSFYFLFGINENVVINIKDTYYVIEPFTILIPLFISIFFFVYLVRVFIGKFNNLIANFIFLTFNLLTIILFTYLLIFVNSQIELAGSIEYPPISGGVVEVKGNNYQNFFYLLLFFQMTLIVLQSFLGIKTGMKYKSNKFSKS